VGGAPTMRLTDSTQGSGMLRCPHGSPPLSHRARRPRVVACARARRHSVFDCRLSGIRFAIAFTGSSSFRVSRYFLSSP
jgi:hypothetical protein